MSSENRNPRLEAAGAELVRRLKGTWHDGGGMCLCPCHDDRTPSLSIRVGAKSLLFKCFAGCSTIDILHELRAQRLSVPTDPSAAARPVNDDVPDPMAALAREIWDGTRTIIGTAGEDYLADRGLAARPPDLRFHPRTPVGRGRNVRFRPAIIAAVREGERLVAIQRLFLDAHGIGLATDLEKAKLTLGRPRRGAVRLSPAETILGLAEGIETAMSASMLLGIPVWAALGSERLHQVLLPTTVRRLILLPDADKAGRIATGRSRQAYARDDLSLGLLWPWGRQNDWSDVLGRPDLWEGRMGEGRVRLAA